MSDDHGLNLTITVSENNMFLMRFLKQCMAYMGGQNPPSTMYQSNIQTGVSMCMHWRLLIMYKSEGNPMIGGESEISFKRATLLFVFFH